MMLIKRLRPKDIQRHHPIGNVKTELPMVQVRDVPGGNLMSNKMAPIKINNFMIRYLLVFCLNKKGLPIL